MAEVSDLNQEFSKQLYISSEKEPMADHGKETADSTPKLLPSSLEATNVHETNSSTSPMTVKESPATMDAMLTKCKEFALSKEFHNYLITDKDYCPILLFCLDSENQTTTVVHRALEVFHLLAVNAENAQKLSKVEYFFESLQAVASNPKMPVEIRDFAFLISEIVKKAQQFPLKAQSGSKQNQTQNINQRGTIAAKKAEGASLKRSHNQSISKGKTVELYVPLCIFKQKRLRMTEALLTLNGIISITYDLKKCYCVIRAKSHIASELFGKTIANLGFECHLVSHEADELIMTPMTADPKLWNDLSSYDKENEGRKSPQYLSDSETESDISIQETQAVAKTTGGGKADEKKGWFSSAANFIQKSLYW